MLYSFIFVFLFLALCMGILLFPKAEFCINVVHRLPIVIIAIICMEAVGAAFLQILGFDIDIKSSSIILLLINTIIWYCVVKKGNIQKLVCPWKDIVLVLLSMTIVIIESYHMFSGDLRLSYLNDDAQSFFSMAMSVVRNKRIDGVYFNAYINALFIEVAAPWLPVVEYYKAFIVGDICMHLLEVWMFFSLINSFCKEKMTYYLSPIICALYFLGYPTFSFMRGNFVYWSTGGILFLFIAFALVGLERVWKYRCYYFVLLALGVYGSVVCNKLYAIINPICAISMVLIIYVRKKKIHVPIIKIIVLLGISSVIMAACFQERLYSLLMAISKQLTIDGFTYRALYQDFIYFIPVLVISFIYVYIKKERDKLICNLEVIILGFTVGMYWLFFKGYVSGYYYYKIYYCLWIVCWLAVAMVLDILCEKKQVVSVGMYAMFLSSVALLQFPNIQNETEDMDCRKILGSIDYNFYELYEYNFQYFSRDYTSKELADAGRYTSPELLEAYQYIIDNYSDELVRFISDPGNYMQGRWFAAITGMEDGIYYEKYDEIVGPYMRADEKYLVVGKQSEVYNASKHLFNEGNIVYEDELIIMAKGVGNQ